MYFCLLELKQNCTKIYVKETLSFAKRVFIRPGSEENVIFQNIQQAEGFFCKKNYSKNQSHGIQSAENIFSFLKGKKKAGGIYVLCFKASKMLRIGQLMRVLQLSE